MNELNNGLIDLKNYKIPLYRGFNLQSKVYKKGVKYSESDFETMAEWGFNFIRLPLSYWVYGNRENWFEINENEMKDIDQAIELGRQYKIHINLNLHRIPGYCVNRRDLEPYDLFSDDAIERNMAMEGAVYHWKFFADRYKGISNDRLSFDLINEPPFMKSEDAYIVVIKDLIEAIRSVDETRLIFVDGIDIGQTPVMGLKYPGIVQSTRGYQPKAVTHYTANWVPKNEYETFAPPSWPLKDDSGRLWNRELLKSVYIDSWKPLTDTGVQVHVGEWGCFNRTPHDVALAWMSDCLSLWKEAGWGYSMWEFRGAFGILDSGRHDVKYEDYKGYKLDRKMLELLKSFM